MCIPSVSQFTISEYIYLIVNLSLWKNAHYYFRVAQKTGQSSWGNSDVGRRNKFER